MKKMTLTTIVAAIVLSMTFNSHAETGKTIPVKCNNSQIAKMLGTSQDRLNRALRIARPGDTLKISGTCEEAITITQGPLTLDGNGSGAISGAMFEPESTEFNGLVTIDGARGVVLRGLTISDSQSEGVLATNGARVKVEDSLIKSNQTGIRLSQAAMTLRDSTVRDNAGSGLMAITGSTAVLGGEVHLTRNHGAGLFLEGNSMAEIRGAQVHVDNNFLGVIVSVHSTLAVLELASAVGSTLAVRNNAVIGLQLAQGMLMVAGEGRPIANTLIDVSGNGAAGIVSVAGSQIASPFGAARFVVAENPVGMVLATDASVEIRGGLELRDNLGPGLVANGAGVVMLRSWPDPGHPGPISDPNPSSIVGNAGPAVIADFGSRLDIHDVELGGPVICDPTVISRTPVCM